MSFTIPSYLTDYAELYRRDPRAAALAWFADARFGLFMHYGLYSSLGRGEWVMYREAIPIAEYEKLQAQFTAENFDADFITDLALDAGMRYVNITSRHHDSFCLFGSAASDYTSVQAPAGRDLVGELVKACAEKGLGLFLYYSYALDWRHPYFYSRDVFEMARPDYDEPEPRYRWEKDEDFQHYIDFVHTQVRELLINYGPLAGIWFDPIMGYYARPDLFPIAETYAMIRELQPQALIAFKQGANGDEDFASPERHGHSLADRVRERIGDRQAEVAQRAWEGNKHQHNEICDTLQPSAWGYAKADDGSHKGPDQVMEMLDQAETQNCNLLLNTGPLPDGSIHPEDIATLREVGRRLR
ncbi:MAG: alpha-L-fucosidase [Anaerolineae bacterium]